MHVVIAGAGISGLTLASCFQETGKYKVTILEANEGLGGTWLPRKTYHNLETHGCRAGFVTLPALCDGFDRLAHASALDVHRALLDYTKKNDIEDLIQYSTTVMEVESGSSGLKVLWRKQTGATGEIECDFFIATGATAEPHVPNITGGESFRGVVVAAAQLNTELFETILSAKKHVVVLGGSKAAQDTVYNFAFRGYANLHWVFRRTYWGINLYHDMVKNELGPTKGIQAYCRYVLFLVFYLKDTMRGGSLSNILVRFLHRVGFLLNPHPDGKLGNFHGGIFDDTRLKYLKSVPYERAEIKEMKAFSLVLSNNKEVPCDVLVCATGYKNEKVPIATPSGKILAHQLDSSSFFRGMIHPQAPRVAFMNTVTLGNVASDAQVISNWLVKAYIPLLHKVDDESMQSLLTRSRSKQQEEMLAFRCRSFNLWNAFDRPFPFMFHNLRRFRAEIVDPSALSQDADDYWVRAQNSLFERLLYPFSAASFLLRTAGVKM